MGTGVCIEHNKSTHNNTAPAGSQCNNHDMDPNLTAAALYLTSSASGGARDAQGNLHDGTGVILAYADGTLTDQGYDMLEAIARGTSPDSVEQFMASLGAVDGKLDPPTDILPSHDASMFVPSTITNTINPGPGVPENAFFPGKEVVLPSFDNPGQFITCPNKDAAIDAVNTRNENLKATGEEISSSNVPYTAANPESWGVEPLASEDCSVTRQIPSSETVCPETCTQEMITRYYEGAYKLDFSEGETCSTATKSVVSEPQTFTTNSEYQTVLVSVIGSSTTTTTTETSPESCQGYEVPILTQADPTSTTVPLRSECEPCDILEVILEEVIGGECPTEEEECVGEECSTTCSVPACKPIPCPPPPPPPTCPPPDPAPAPVNQNCGESGEVSRVEREMRWYNLPLAYAEFKNDMSFNNLGETSSNTSSVLNQSYLGISQGDTVPFSLARFPETFEAMLGMPETEKGYLNAGATDVIMDVTAKHVVVTYAYISTRTVTECGSYSCTLTEKPWPQVVDTCSGTATCEYKDCDGSGCETKTRSAPASSPGTQDCGPQYDLNYTSGFEGCVTHTFCDRSEVTYEYFEIVDVTVHVAEKIVSCNPALYQAGAGPVDANGCFEIAYNIPVEVQMNIVPKGHGANYGTTSGQTSIDAGNNDLTQIGKNELSWSGQNCADASYEIEVPIYESYPIYTPFYVANLEPIRWVKYPLGTIIPNGIHYQQWGMLIPVYRESDLSYWYVEEYVASGIGYERRAVPCLGGREYCPDDQIPQYIAKVPPAGYVDIQVGVDTQNVAQVDCEAAQSGTGVNDNATDKDELGKLQDNFLSDHNNAFGEVFARSDSLTIYVGTGANRQVYEFIPSGVETNAGGDASEVGVAGQGVISAAAMGRMFNPISERWSYKRHVPVSGYTGMFLGTPERNTTTLSNANKTPIGDTIWLKTGVPLVPRLPNGVYSFEPYAKFNYVQYKKIDHGYPVSQSREIYSDNSGWRDGSTSNVSHVPESATNPSKHKGNQYNQILLEYTAWQLTGTREPSHHVNGPNGPSSYYSVNPVIIHNPVSAVAWIHDTYDNTLKDQRIETLASQPNGDIVPHSRAVDVSSPARLYVDYDFKLTVANHGFFQQFSFPNGGTTRGDNRTAETWSINKSNRDRGVENVFMGTYFAGPGYVGVQTSVETARSRFYPGSLLHTISMGGTVDLWGVSLGSLTSITSPPKEQGVGNGHSDTGWDVSKWINAKFVQFPFDVYYYGTYDPDSGSPTNNPFSSGWGGNQYPGGDPAGFYRAGTWIKIFDHGGNIVVGSDYADNANKNPEVFDFRVASHVRDMADAEIFVLNESINSPYRHLDTQSRAQIQWSESSSWVTNMTRSGLYSNSQPNNTNALTNPSMQRLASLAAASGNVNHHNVRQSSMHSARNVLYADVIGRIGNVAVDDTADPQWSSIFWDTSGGKINVNSAVSRGFAVYYNMFDSVQPWINTSGLINGSKYPWTSNNPAPAGGFINRFSTLSAWHNFQETLGGGLDYALPIMTNPIPQYSGQTVKLGYEIQASVQTLGDYDREGAEMWVYPRYSLIGNYTTSNSPDERFHLYATDQWSAGQPIKEYWDSYLQFGRHFQTAGSAWAGASNNGTRHLALGNSAWYPQFEHKFYHSLADPRAKINPMEKYTVSYQDAVKKGSNTTEYLGDPSFIAIPQTLRTWHGGNASVLGGAAVTKGRSGQSNDWWMIQSSPNVSSGSNLFSKTFATAGSTPEQYWQVNDIKYAALSNAQRWHFRHSLPRTTQVIFESQLPNNQFEGRTKDQYIGVGFVFRTVGKNGLWDLSTYTNTTAASAPYIYPDPDTELGWNPSNDPEKPGWDRGTKDWFRRRVGRPWYPSAAPETNNPPVFEPFTPIIILDYSNPSQTDSTTIGTH